MPSSETENVFPVVVILTAIPVEYQAVKVCVEHTKEDIAEDGTIYESGVFRSDGQQWTVVIRETGAGNVPATSAVHLAWERYHPDVMLFCGIAGGRKDVEIGDVVVPDKVYNYHSGRVELDFSARPVTYCPSQAIIERAKLEGQSHDWTRAEITSERSAKETKVLVKPIASGEELVASRNSDTLERISRHYNDAVAIEMEGYGFLHAAQKCGVKERLLIRGISDLLDKKQESDRQDCQQLASRNAAAFAFHVLRKFRPKSMIERTDLTEKRAPEKRDETTQHEKTRTPEGSKSSGQIPELTVVTRFRDKLEAKGIYEIGVEERVRLFVLAGSLLPYNVKCRELGNHLLHRMYLNRDNEDLTSNEEYLIYTTLLGDSWDRKTGWYWLRKTSSKRLVQLLEQDAVSKIGDDESRRGAIRRLQMLEPSKAEASLVKIVKDCEHEQKRSILDYFCAHGSSKALDVVEKLTVGEHEGVTSKAILAKVGILSRCDPAQAVKIMVDEAKKDPKLCEEAALGIVISKMNTRILRKLTAANYLYAFRELARRGKASDAELERMLQSNDPETQFLGYSELLKRGVKFDPEEIRSKWPKSQRWSPFGFFGIYHETQGKNWLEKALLEAYLQMPIAELEKNVQFTGQGRIVYLAWGLRGADSVVQVIRDDVRERFERLRVSRLAKIEALKEDAARIQKMKDDLQTIESSVVAELTVSALKVLEKYGNAGDKVLAKTFLKSEDAQVRAAAVDLFAKYAGKGDIDGLSKIVSDGDAEARIVAAKRILKLDAGETRSLDLLESSYSDVVKETICWCIANKERLDRTKVSALLCSENDEIRLLATAYAAKTWTRERLVSLLKRYLGGKTYYYDVVCWLDRVLYAPTNLAQGYKKKLIKRFD